MDIYTVGETEDHFVFGKISNSRHQKKKKLTGEDFVTEVSLLK